MGKKITSLFATALALAIPALASAQTPKLPTSLAKQLETRATKADNERAAKAAWEQQKKSSVKPVISVAEAVKRQKAMAAKQSIMRRADRPMGHSVNGAKPITVTQVGNRVQVLTATGSVFWVNCIYSPEIAAGSSSDWFGPTTTEAWENPAEEPFFTGLAIDCGVAADDSKFYGWFRYNYNDTNYPARIVFDQSNWEEPEIYEVYSKDGQYVDWEYMAAYDAASLGDGKEFGIFFTEDGQGYEYAIIDNKDMSRQVINSTPSDVVSMAMGVTPDKQTAYFVSNGGDLYKVDLNTGVETLVGFTGVTPNYLQTGEIDPADGTFYWIAIDNTNDCAVYTIDLETAAATKIYQFNGLYEFTSMIFPEAGAEEGAPAAIEDLEVVFEDAALTGTVTFTAPATTNAGEALAGDLTYTFAVDDDEQAPVAVAAGAEVSFTVTVEEGLHSFAVYTTNAAGNSRKASATVYAGNDNPEAPANVTLTLDGNTATITWEASESGSHGGYVDAAAVTYDVVRLTLTDETVVANGLTALTYTDELPADMPLTLLGYNVIAVANGKASTASQSNNEIAGEALEAPYYQDFTDINSLLLWNVFDNNEDGTSWSVNTSYGYAYYSWNSANGADDYLVMPPFKATPGKSYVIEFDTYCGSSSYPERIEVVYGNALSVEAMNKVALEPTDVTATSSEPMHLEAEAIADADGKLYIAFHAISDADEYYLYLTNITVTDGPLPTQPAGVTDLAVVPNADGQLNAAVSFTAPTKNKAGNDLQGNILKLELSRNGEVINTWENVAPGTALQFTDNVDEAGIYNYVVVPFDADGASSKSNAAKVYIGIDIPLFVEDMTTVSPEDNKIKIGWTEVPNVGMNGGVVKPAEVKYTAWTVEAELYFIWYFYTPVEVMGSVVGENSVTFDYPTEEGDQRWDYFAVQTENETGTQDDFADYGVIGQFVGAPYEIPFQETFANGGLDNNWFYEGYSGDADIAFGAESSDGDGSCLQFTGQRGDTIAVTPGKVALGNAENPVLVFSYKSTNSVGVKTAVKGGDDSWIETSPLTPGNNTWKTVKVELKDFVGGRAIRPVIIGNFRNAGHPINIDDVMIYDQLRYDVAVKNVEAPAKVNAGEDITVNYTVQNLGTEKADNVIVNLLYTDENENDDAVVTLKSDTISLASLETKKLQFSQPTSIFSGESVIFDVEVVFAEDLDQENNELAVDVDVKQSTLPQPENVILETANLEGARSATVSWTAPVLNEVSRKAGATVTEGFEDQSIFVPFSTGGINESNRLGSFGEWKVYDEDAQETYNISGVSHDNTNGVMAFMPFNPSLTNPDVTDRYPAYEGEQYMLAYACTSGANSDWLISPALDGSAQTISFFARALSGTYVPEQYEVLYSATSNTDIESFVKVAEGDVSTTEWTEISATLPQGAKYFAIRCVSYDMFALLIDNVTYAPEGAAQPVLTAYNIYVDHAFVVNAKASETESTFPHRFAGTEKIYVSAVYDLINQAQPNKAERVESAPVLAVGDVTGIEQLIVEGKNVNIYTMDGKLIRSNAANANGLRKGVYVVDGKKAVVK